MEFNDFTLYFDAASGSERKALKVMEEPHVMINFQTRNNTPWSTDMAMVNSGGFISMRDSGEQCSPQAYLDFIEDNPVDIFVLPDFPCEQEVLDEHGRTVKEHIENSLDAEMALLRDVESRGPRAEPMAALQGWSLDDYRYCIDRFRDEGLLERVDYVGIGSVCQRERVSGIAEVISFIADEVGDTHHLHAFGISRPSLSSSEVIESLDSANTGAWGFGVTRDPPGPRWHGAVADYLDFKETVADRISAAQPRGSSSAAEVNW